MTTNSTGTGSPVEGPRSGLDAAVDAFASALAPAEDKPEDEEANAEVTEEVTEEPEVEEEVAEEETETEAAEESEEEEEQEQESSAPVFTVRVDGKEVEVTQDELIAGYSRTADYTRKTQALAEERKGLEQELDGLRKERAEYAELLPKLRARLEAGLGPEPDWEALRAQDPAQAAVLWQRREEMRRHLQTVAAEEERLSGLSEEDRQEQLRQRLIVERNALLEKLPEWRDEKVARKEAEAIKGMLAEIGFSDGEAALQDHRLVLMARKAAKFDELMKQAPKIREKASKAPVVKPGGGVKPVAKPAQQAKAKLARSGTVSDAAAVFAQHLR